LFESFGVDKPPPVYSAFTAYLYIPQGRVFQALTSDHTTPVGDATAAPHEVSGVPSRNL